MSNIEDAIRRLTPEQRALLERRLKQKRKDSPAQDTSIRPRPDTSVIPLSAGQRRLLALEQLFPNTPQFNITVARRLMGTLDVSLFEASIRHVLERHEVLRGRFSLLNNVWQQQIGEVPEVCLKRLDLSHLPAPKRLQRAIEVVRKDLETPFDLSRGPLMRAGLIKMGPNDFLFSITIHHIAADAWSVNLLLQEVAEVYSARIIDAPSPLEKLPIQYADFAHWQINWLETDEAAKQLAYWENTFDEAPEQLKLPTDSDPRTVQSVDGAAQTVFLSKELTASLKDVSINHKLTPFTLFLAAFKATLYRYTHQNDMIVCAPIAGRHRVEVEPLVGYFNNLIAIRSSLADDVTYRTLANQIADTSMAASDHQDIPFEVVADLPTLRRTPLTRAFFTFQDALAHSFELEGIDSEPIELETAGADFDLSLFIEQKGEDLAIVAEYKKQLFKEDQIAEILANYQLILGAIARDAHIRLGELPSFAESIPEEDKPDATVSLPPPPADETVIEVENITLKTNGQKPLENMSGDELPAQAEPVAAPRPVIAPDDDLEQILLRIWQRALGITEIGLHDNFFEIGGHSLMAVNMFTEIQKYVGDLDLPLAVLLEAPTIASLAHRIRHSDEIEWSPLAVIQSGRGTLPIFCIHGAGGNVLLYRDLAIQLGPDQAVFGLQAQGMDGKTPIISRIEDMAASYVRAIRKAHPTGPYLLVGYCMGGVVALEMAKQLQRQGQDVPMLAMLESYNWAIAPKETRIMKWKYMIEKIKFHIKNYMILSGYEKKLFKAEKIAELKRRRKVWAGKLMGILRPKQLIEANDEGPNNRALAEVWKANDEAVFHYKPGEFPGRVMLFLPQQEYSYHKSEELKWADVARKVDRHVLSVYPGGMLIQPFVKELAQALRAEIFRISSQIEDSPASTLQNGHLPQREQAMN